MAMMKRLMSALLVVCMVVALLVTSAFAADSKEAEVAMKATATGAAGKYDVSLEATLTMTDGQAKSAAALGKAELLKKEFVCTLSDSEDLIASNKDKLEKASVTMNSDSIFKLVSQEVKDGNIVIKYSVKESAVSKLDKAEDLYNVLKSAKATVKSAVKGIELKKSVSDELTAVVKLDDNLLAKGTTTLKIVYTPFVDIENSPDNWYIDAVDWAVSRDPFVTNGVDSTHFAPDKACTREEAVTFIWRAAGCPAPKATTCAFKDVDANAYSYKAILWAVENEITNGTSTENFSPKMICNRAHIVTFLYRWADDPSVAGLKNSFKDVESGTWYTDAVLWAAKNEVTNGMGADTFKPMNDCTRAMIVTFLWRADGVMNSAA